MTNNKNIEEQEKELFSRLKPDYSKSKEDVWSALEKVMGEKQQAPKKKSRTIPLVWIKYAAAACFLLVFGLGLFARFYSTEITVPSGHNSQHTLPDGSTVYLNAESSLKYKPYWWNFTREVELKGEAFFEVKKGESFSVYSEMGSVEVLGTSFNVYSRSDSFGVYCKSGKVRVRDNFSNEVILLPEQFVSANGTANTLQLNDEVNMDEIMAWRLNKFVYNTTPFTKVLGDFERHYGIQIETDVKSLNKLHYTGLFMRDIGAEKALDIVCFSFELKLEKTGKNAYLIKQ